MEINYPWFTAGKHFWSILLYAIARRQAVPTTMADLGVQATPYRSILHVKVADTRAMDTMASAVAAELLQHDLRASSDTLESDGLRVCLRYDPLGAIVNFCAPNCPPYLSRRLSDSVHLLPLVGILAPDEARRQVDALLPTRQMLMLLRTQDVPHEQLLSYVGELRAGGVEVKYRIGCVGGKQCRRHLSDPLPHVLCIGRAAPRPAV